MIIICSTVIGISVDCPDMINLSIGLHINTKQSAIWTALQSDCCTAAGVTCVGNRVTQVNWDTKGLDGAINGTALPSSLLSLVIWNNQLTGSIPIALPSGLTNLGIWSNSLTGSIPVLPSTLQSFDASWNQLSGTLPSLPSGLLVLHLHGNKLHGDLSVIPPSMQDVTIGWAPNGWGNHFTGTLTLLKPTTVQINFNLITDINILDISALSGCDLSYNPLLGNPHLVSLPMCLKNGLYNASTLPNTRTTSRAVKTTIFASTGGKATESELTTKSDISSMSYSLTTESFEMPLFSIIITFSTVLRIFVDFVIFGTVIKTTPFKREIRKLMRKERKVENDNILLSK